MAERGRVVVVRSTEVAGDSRAERVVRHLLRRGHRVHVLCWRRTDVDILPAADRVRVTAFDHPAPYGAGLGNLMGQARWQRWVREQLGGDRDPRPALAYACDLDAARAVGAWATSTGVPWVYDQFDPYRGRIAVPGVRGLVGRLEEGTARRATARVVPSDHRRVGAFADAAVVENAPDEPRTPTGEGRPGTLFYGGVLVDGRGLRTARQAVSRAEGWTFRVAGFGPLEKELGAAAPDVEWLGRLGHPDLLAGMSGSSVVLATYDPADPNNRRTASNKLAEAAWAGRPIVASEGTVVGAAVAEHRLGHVVRHGDVDGLVGVLETVAGQGPDDRAALAAAGDRYLADHGWPVQERRLDALLDRVMA